MDVTVVAPPNDSMWWVLRPEFIGFIDKFVIDKKQWLTEESSKNKSGYHKMVWDRLSVLMDEKILIIEELDLPSVKIEKKADCLIRKALNENPEILIEDLMKAYEYWISYNKMKIRLLPKNQKYRKKIVDLLPVWESDLSLLQNKKTTALEEQPKILNYVAMNIFIKVLELEHLNKKYEKCAFSSLREYEPFVKYIPIEEPIHLTPETTKLTSSNKLMTNLREVTKLSVEPDYEFLKFTLSKMSFKKKLKNIQNNYRPARAKLKQMIEKTDDFLFGLIDSSVKSEVTKDLILINKELSSLRKETEKRSKYLSFAFSGISLLPIPVVSQIFGLLGMGGEKLSEYLESVKFSNRGFSPNGLSAYFSFLESNIKYKYLDGFPEVEKENERLSSDFFEDTFWRV